MCSLKYIYVKKNNNNSIVKAQYPQYNKTQVQ